MKYNYYITINSFNPKNVIGWPHIAKTCLQNKSFKILFNSTSNYHIDIKSDLTRNGFDKINFIDSKNISFIENDIIVNLDESNSTNIPININCKVITALCGYKRNRIQDQLDYIKKIKPFKVYTEILEDEYLSITSTTISNDILDIMYFLPPYINRGQQSKELEIVYENKVDIVNHILFESLSPSSDIIISLKSINKLSFNSLQNKLIINQTDYPQLSHISNSITKHFNFLFYSSFINPLRLPRSKHNNIYFINENDFESVRKKFTKYFNLFKNIKTQDIKSRNNDNNFLLNLTHGNVLNFENEVKLKNKSHNCADFDNNKYNLNTLLNYISDYDHYDYCFLSFIIAQYKFDVNSITTKLITMILRINHSYLFSYFSTNNSKLKYNRELIYSIYHSLITDKTKDFLIIQDFISILNSININEYNYLKLKLLLFSKNYELFHLQENMLFEDNDFCIRTAYHSSLHELFHPTHSQLANTFIKSIYNKIQINKFSTDELLIYARFSVINNNFNAGFDIINNLLNSKKISVYYKLHFTIFSYIYSLNNNLCFKHIKFETPSYTKNEILNLITLSLIDKDFENFSHLIKKLITEFESIFDFKHLTLAKLLPFILIGVHTKSDDILKKSINILNENSIDVFEINDFSSFKINNINNLKIDVDLILNFLEPK